MSLPRFVVWMLLVCITILGASKAVGQNYPNKPIRIVTGAPGSGNDFNARLIGAGISDSLGQRVIVDNRAGQEIPAGIVAKSPPDGYTLLFSSSTLWLAPFLHANVAYDPVRDFSPITLATNSPNILVVHPSLPIKTVKELIDLARARPGELNCAWGPMGGSIHLAAELFRIMTVIDIVGIPYKGTAQALNAVISGEAQLMFPNAGVAMPHIQSSRLRALAVTTAQRSTLVPGLPTVASSGLSGYESSAMFGIFAPTKTPTSIINRLNQEIIRILNKEDVQEKMRSAGVEVVGSSPEAFGAAIRAEMARMGKVIKDAGIQAD